MPKHPPPRLPPEVVKELGWYVYLLIDPANDRPFYVGKGQGNRAISHLRQASFDAVLRDSHATRPTTNATQARLRTILHRGLKPRIDIVKHNLPNEASALAVEAALISSLRPLEPAVTLTNAIGGHDGDTGRASLDELVSRYGAPELTATEPPVVMIRLAEWSPRSEPIDGTKRRTGNGWYQGITSQELYDSTRGWWRISPASVQRRGADHAVAVHAGVTRCVIRIDHDSWRMRPADGRHAFSGTLLNQGKIVDTYLGRIGKKVPFPRSAQNPITHWPTSAA